ncbi:MAG: N-acetyltransferase [Bacteroidia bacterium]|nr:N-acetyltransferase [Bacteroidia bacterium]
MAAQLVEQIVHFARQNGLKLVPVCSYARQVLNETADYQDVLG